MLEIGQADPVDASGQSAAPPTPDEARNIDQHITVGHSKSA
jgi:hypothetical protein